MRRNSRIRNSRSEELRHARREHHVVDPVGDVAGEVVVDRQHAELELRGGSQSDCIDRHGHDHVGRVERSIREEERGHITRGIVLDEHDSAPICCERRAVLGREHVKVRRAIPVGVDLDDELSGIGRMRTRAERVDAELQCERSIARICQPRAHGCQIDDRLIRSRPGQLGAGHLLAGAREREDLDAAVERRAEVVQLDARRNLLLRDGDVAPFRSDGRGSMRQHLPRQVDLVAAVGDRHVTVVFGGL